MRGRSSRRRRAAVRPLPALSCAALALSLVSLGCENENLAACQGFVDHYRSLPCTGGAAPEVDCNAFSDYPCVVDDYFTCLEQGHTCNEAGDLAVTLVQEAPDGTTYACADLLDCEG